MNNLQLFIFISFLFKFTAAYVITEPSTFLCDADGATAHPDSQSIHTGVDQILGLGCCDHCRWRNMKTVRKRVQMKAAKISRECFVFTIKVL